MSDDFTKELIGNWKAASRKTHAAIRVFLKRFSRQLPASKIMQQVHEEVFADFNCLLCANCCTNSSPVFNRTDINRISAYLGQTARNLETHYLQADSEGDFIPKSKPCPFLEADNRCRVYEVRPRSCRGFPHTDNTDCWNRPVLMAGNAKACPAAYAIVEKFRWKQPGL